MLAGLRNAITEVRNQSRALARATTDDLKKQARAAGIGVGFGAGAALIAVFAIGFLLATIAFVLSLFLPTWAALTIVTVALFVCVFVLIVLARRQFQKVPVVPDHAVRGAERQKFIWAVNDLRRELTLSAKARARVPAVAAGVGFVLGGGLRAIARLARPRR